MVTAGSIELQSTSDITVQKLHERIAASEVVCESAATFIERIFDSLTDDEAQEAGRVLRALLHFSSRDMAEYTAQQAAIYMAWKGASHD